ncbi:MAG TPA: ester cyclase [Ignavibacteriaceae bacterium]|nr:ester cyclase [Ignavibacteriaceae bacterium]
MKQRYFFLSPVFLFLFFISACQTPQTEDPSIKQNKIIAVKMMQVFDKGDIAALDTMLTDDVVDHQLDTMYIKKTGKEGVKEMFQYFDKAVNGKHTTIHSMAVSGDTVMVFSTTVGTWVDSLMGMPPTNKEIKFPGVDIIRVANGKIAEHWGFLDMAAMAQFTMPPMEQGKGKMKKK